MLAMSRVAALLLSLGSAKLARPNLILHPKTVLAIHHEVSVGAVFLCGLRGKISITSMRPW